MQAGTERPRFRQDLFAEAVEEQGAKYVDIMDPDSGSVFRFYEVEFSIACAMDGERDVAGIVKWAQDELGVTPAAHEVQAVIATLGQLGYLDMTGGAKAAAADTPATSGLAAGGATSGLAAAGGTSHDTVVDAPALKMPPARTPTPAGGVAARTPTPAGGVAARRPTPAGGVAARTPTPVGGVATRTPTPVGGVAARTPTPAGGVAARTSPAPGTTSEVSLDLSEHLAVGREDVQEAVRQSRVMAAVEVPPDLMEPSERPAARPTPMPAEAKPPERPTPTPAEAKPPERPTPMPVETKQPERPTPMPAETRQPERPAPVAVPTPTPAERPVEAKQPEAHKPPVSLPQVPEKQPVPPPAPSSRVSPVLIVLILVVLGIGGFLVWQFLLNKPAGTQPSASTGTAPAAPQPTEPPAPPPEPPKKLATAKLEMVAAPPAEILARGPGAIAWIEASAKEVKANDVVVKLQGYKGLEDQVAALTKDAGKLKADLDAAYKVRNELPREDEAAVNKAQAKIDALEKTAGTKAEQLKKKTDQLEPYYLRAPADGAFTTTRKVGEKVAKDAAVATITGAPVPSATFTVPPEVKAEAGQATKVTAGERQIDCEIAAREADKLRVACPKATGLTEGAPVSWQLP